MIYDAIVDAMEPKPNAYLMNAVMSIMEGPMEMVREALEKVRLTKPSAPESKVDMAPPQILEGSEALAYMDRVEGYKTSHFTVPEDPHDLSFMAAIESMNAERLKVIREHTQTIAATADDLTFG